MIIHKQQRIYKFNIFIWTGFMLLKYVIINLSQCKLYKNTDHSVLQGMISQTQIQYFLTIFTVTI